MNKKLLYLKDLLPTLYMAFLFCGCSQSQKLIPLTQITADITSIEEMKLTDYFENFRIVKLSSDSIINKIRKIRYENNHIYVSDGRGVFIFSETGELMHNFSKIGNGPGEYLYIDDFVVNGDSIIVISRSSRRQIIYNHSGEIISTQNLAYWAKSISPMVNNTLFIYCGNDYSPPQMQYKLRRIQNGQEDSQYLPIDENQGIYLHVMTEHYFNKHEEFIYFFEVFNDTIFESINGDDIKPAFRVDYQGKNIPASFFGHKYADIREFFQAYFTTSYAYGVVNFAMFDRFLMFSSFYQKNQKLTVFDHKDNISHTYVSLKDDAVFKGLTLPISEFSYHATEKHVIFPLEATEVEEWREKYAPAEPFKEQINATHWDDNPVLLIFNVKK